jgi:hypothetical protein
MTLLKYRALRSGAAASLLVGPLACGIVRFPAVSAAPGAPAVGQPTTSPQPAATDNAQPAATDNARPAASVCNGEQWPVLADPDRSALMVAMGCGPNDPSKALGYLWTSVDHGTTRAVGTTAAVIACGSYYEPNYFMWRTCELDAAKFTRDVIERDLEAIRVPSDARRTILEHYEAARHQLDAHAAAMAELERGYPAEKELFDAAVKQVTDHYVPMFTKWNAQLADLDAWETGLQKGPGYAGDCVPKLTSNLQAYVRTIVSKAEGDALLSAMKDPIGHRFTHALAECFIAKGDQAGGELVEALAGHEQVNGFHDAIGEALRNNAPEDKYKGVALKDKPTLEYLRYHADNPHSIDQVHIRAAMLVAESRIASVDTEGDNQKITFARESVPWSRADCDVDYHTVVGIDSYGNFRFREYNCRTVSGAADATPRPLLVPSGSAGPIAKGMLIMVSNALTNTRRVAWLRRGHDVIWSVGMVAK